MSAVAGEALNEWGREFQGHDKEGFFRGAAKPVFNRVTIGIGLVYDSIELSDLVGDHSLQMMSEFVNRCGRNPPISYHTKKPYAVGTMHQVLGSFFSHLLAKFAGELANVPELFPNDEVSKWKKSLKDNHN